MKLAIAVCVVVCALAVPGASATSPRAPSPTAAKAALGRLLHQFYGGIRGYWTCPPPAFDGRIDCLAEVHNGRLWHQIVMSARNRNGVIAFTTLTNHAARTWTRHWWPFSRHWIAGGPPGVASVNSNAYGWGVLASGAADLKDGAHKTVLGYDGDAAGFFRFFRFSCSRDAGLISCRNALGDAIRYRPHPS
jgi:hypothetical protein